MLKKLNHLIDQLLADHIITNHKEYTDFIRTFLEYLSVEDEGAYNKVMNFTDNTHPATTYPELLDALYEERFKVFDNTVVDLTEDEKRSLVTFESLLTLGKSKKSSVEIISAYFDEVDSIEVDETITSTLDYTVTVDTNAAINVLDEYLENVHPMGYERNISIALPITFSDTIVSPTDTSTIYVTEFYEFNGEYSFDGEIEYVPANTYQI